MGFYVSETDVDKYLAEELSALLDWIKKESLASSQAGVLGYDFVHRLEEKLSRRIFELESPELLEH